MDNSPKRSQSQWRFLQLTLVIVAWMLASPHLEARWSGHLALQILLLDLLLVTIWANPDWRRTRHVVGALWLLSVITSLSSVMELTPQWLRVEKTVDIVLSAPVVAACVLGVLGFAFRAERPTVDGIFATVVAYFLIAMLFAELYYLLVIWDPEALRLLAPSHTITPRELRGELVYFSLVTLATLGYGDVLPVSPLARTLATMEAVVGQFYVAVVVAAFVGKYAAWAEARRSAARSGSDPERG